MARINSMGLDDILDDLHAAARNNPTMMQHMIDAAGDVYEEETKRQIVAYKIFDTGTTHYRIKRGKSTKKGDGLRLEVWPAGTRRDKDHPKGERVETVAFIAQYGTKKIKARPFMSDAALRAEGPATEAMAAVLERESKL